MRKILLFTTLTISLAGQCQDELNLSLRSVGKPYYQKDLKADRGLTVYKSDDGSFVQVLPKEYYNVGKITDTLTLRIKGDSTSYVVDCENCNEMKFSHTVENDINYFTFSTNGDFVKFIATFEKEPHGMYSAPPVDKFSMDTAIGFVRLKNTFIHYCAIPDLQNAFIGVIDKNFNGRIDQTDYVSVSNDDFFFTVQSDRANEVGKIHIIEINGVQYEFKLTDPNDLNVSLKRLETKVKPDVILMDTLYNITFGTKDLYSSLEKKDFVLLSYWSEFCSPCIKNVSNLNNLPDNVEVIGLYSGSQGLEKVKERYSIDYFNIECSKELESKLNLNGFPNYILIDKNKKIILNTRDFNEILKLI